MLFADDEKRSGGDMVSLAGDAFKQFLLSKAKIPFLISDRDGQVLECNKALLSLLGVTKDRLSHIAWDRRLIPVGESDLLAELMGRASRPFEAVLFDEEGGQSFVEVLACPFQLERNEEGVGVYLFDITKYRENEEKLRRQALHDPLTGLPNRSLMTDRLMEAVASLERGEEGIFAILFVDLDDFKGINDTYGHDAGDATLIEVGRRLQQGIRKYDKASRWGGDEFVVYFGAIADKNGIKKRVRELLKSLAEPFDFNGNAITIRASIGLVFNEGSYQNHRDMLLDADRAMYRAKKSGGNCFVVHEVNTIDLDEWDDPAQDLEEGLSRGEIFLEYQPIVRISDRKLVGAEALVRWRHPQRGLIPPPQIINLADSAGLCDRLSLWIVDQATADLETWNNGLPEYDSIYVHLNCPTSLLEDPEFSKTLAEKLESNGSSTSRLYLELPKEALENGSGIHSGQTTLSANFKGMVAVDDLSLTIKCLNFFYNLEAIPFDVVKIDKSIVQYICQDKSTRETLLSFVKIFSSMGLDVVAKNVETEEQFNVLKSLNCTYAQGYYISAPVGVRDILQMLK